MVPEAPFDLAECDRLLSTTRAVRRRLDLERPVAREVILECIALAQQAPTASNRQDWRWLVVTEPERRAAIAGVYRELAAGALPGARAGVPESDRQTLRVYDSAQYLADHLHEVPVLVVPCLAGRLPAGAPPALGAAHWGSILPAVWSFQLALRARGLGSVLTTLHLLREADVASLLGLPPEFSQAALLPVAYTKGTEFAVARRPPPEAVTRFERWSG